MPQYELNFRDYLRIIRKRKFIIIASFVLSILLAIFYTRTQPTVYRAYATVKYEEQKTAIATLVERVTWSRGDPLDTEVRVIQSRKVAEEVVRRLGLITEKTSLDDKKMIIADIQSSISAEKVKDASLIRITAVGKDPNQITRIANMTAQVYIDENLNQKRREARETREFIQERIVTVEKELTKAEERLTSFKEKESITGVAIQLENKLVGLKSRVSELLARATEKHPEIIRIKTEIKEMEGQLKTLPVSELQYARLKRDVEINEKTYRMLREKFEQARIVESEKSPDVTLISASTEPKYPVGPNRRLNLILGSLTGLMLGFILAFITENLDTSIGTIEDVESIIKLPVLGVIPSVKTQEKEDLKVKRRKRFINLGLGRKEHREQLDLSSTCLIVQSHPHLPVSEAYRMLRTNLKISPQQKAILFSSTGPREGKTTILVCLGLVFAQMGTKVVLVDSDLRRPMIAKIFGIEREPGLTDVIAGTSPPI